MPEATLHDGSTIEIEIHGAGPTLLLPVNPQPVTGPLAEQMRQYGTDPALGQSLIKGLSDAFRVVAFDYEGQCLRRPKPDTLTPANIANDLLAVAVYDLHRERASHAGTDGRVLAKSLQRPLGPARLRRPV